MQRDVVHVEKMQQADAACRKHFDDEADDGDAAHPCFGNDLAGFGDDGEGDEQHNEGEKRGTVGEEAFVA